MSYLDNDNIQIRFEHDGVIDQDNFYVYYVFDLPTGNMDIVSEEYYIVDFINKLITLERFTDLDIWTVRLFAFFEDGSQDDTRYHSTIFLKEIESSSIGCDVAVDALWMNYTIYTSIDPPAPPVPVPFDHSELLISRYDDNTGACATAEMTIYQEPLSFADSEISAPLHAQYNPNHRYCFRVRSYSSIDPDLYAYSNYKKDLSISDTIAPQHIAVLSVDVDYDADNIVVAGFSNDEDVKDFVFELYRSTDGIDFPNVPVQQLLGSDIINPDQFNFIDVVDVDEGPYYYSIKSVNKECEIYFFEAEDIVPSIFLETSLTVVGTDLQIIFEWNYDDYFDSYQYARLEINGQETPIIFVDEDYTESLSIEELGTLITSWIEAEDSEGNPVRSNRTELRIDILDRANIPNAFRPEFGLPDNQKFILPFIISNTEEIEYNIRIINKNGQEMFRYNDRYDENLSAWNGQVMNTGPDAPAGAYVYELEYAIPGSPPETKRGVVYLIR